MFEVKVSGSEKKEASTRTDEGGSIKHRSLGSVGSGSGSGSGSLYLHDSQDWVLSPSCSPDEPHNAISPMLAEETFRYMILSADRVEQMTRMYNDIDVVTHLLSERDRDLELAARIGQSLLQRNHVLQERNDSLEEQMAQALDQVHQLQHELSKKDELLRMVASASEESETDSSCSTPRRPALPPGGAVSLSQLEVLHCKLQELEEENVTLRSEACHLKKETVAYEEKEQQLVSDCVKEIRVSNSHMVNLADELSRKSSELVRHQEEIAQLLSQIVDLQHRVKELALEKEDLRMHLQASKDAQRQLTAELNELADGNAECVGMLHETQEEIRELRNRNTPSAGFRRHLPYGLFPMDSLAAEIEGTMRREMSVEEETAFEDQRVSQKRVFQAVRSVNETVERAASAPPLIPGSGRSSLVMTSQPFQSAQGGELRLGKPGSPGGSDLTAALNRLSLRQQNYLCERQFFQAEREKKLQALADPDTEGSGWSSPMGSATSSFSNLSEFSITSSCFKTFLPEKLQIVKPMEGSLTLHHWQMLAKPHLGTILDPHPGVVTKGFRPLPLDNIYRLTDLEEDGEDEEQSDGGVSSGKHQEKKGAKEQEEEEEEGGITFDVRCSSTPEEQREKKRPMLSTPAAPLSSTLGESPKCAAVVPATSDPSLTSSLRDPINNPGLAAQTTSSAPAQTQTGTITTMTTVSAPNPGKCQSSTFSTYTFTTCRILHPSDITQVTSSSQGQSSFSGNTPSSMRTGPSTPVTPCRLSLGDSFPPRPPIAAPCGLAKLVLEKGISALSTDPPKPNVRPPKSVGLPGTPPNSPSRSPSASPVPFQSALVPIDNFLVSRPAELFLQDVYGLRLGRAPRPDLPSPSPQDPLHSLGPGPRAKTSKPSPNTLTVGLLEQLKRLGFTTKLQGPDPGALPSQRHDSSTFVAAGGGSLLDGLRRNQSLPAMIGSRAGMSAYGPFQTAPPLHPTSLDLPPPSWGNLKETQPRVWSTSQSNPLPRSHKH